VPEMTLDRFAYTTRYLRDVFGHEDAHLEGLMTDAVRQGLPDIAVSPDVGRLLLLMTKLTRGRLAVEVGTLGGYSGIWLARGLQDDGHLITIESEEKHARFAATQFEKAGVAHKVSVRQGKGLDVLADLARTLAPGTVDVLFFDAIKREYADYWRVAKDLLAPGGLLIADNVLGAGFWIDQEGHPDRDAIDAFNRSITADESLDATCVPLREGVLIARKR
jgi:predicted O-methyltransferase YrrM